MLALDPNDLKQFSKLEGVQVQTATPSNDFIKNVKINAHKGYRGIQDLPGFSVIKGHNFPIALVGGGPSLKSNLDRLRDFKLAGFPIIACGSVHDYLVQNDIIPEYATICDPDPLVLEYLKHTNKNTKYLLALSLDPCVFDYINGHEFYVWNCRSDEAAEAVKVDVNGLGYADIFGGCTVGLRSMPIAMCLGYTNLHFFGFDSCMGSGKEHHAYEFATDKEEVGETYSIRFGDTKLGEPDKDGKYYICSGYQLAQAWHFQIYLQNFGKLFTPTFHGEGLLPDYYAYLRKRSEEEFLKQKAA